MLDKNGIKICVCPERIMTRLFKHHVALLPLVPSQGGSSVILPENSGERRVLKPPTGKLGKPTSVSAELAGSPPPPAEQQTAAGAKAPSPQRPDIILITVNMFRMLSCSRLNPASQHAWAGRSRSSDRLAFPPAPVEGLTALSLRRREGEPERASHAPFQFPSCSRVGVKAPCLAEKSSPVTSAESTHSEI